MKSSKDTGEIDKAMLEAQKQIDAAHESAYNTFHKSKYADMGDVIEAIKVPLNSNGILVIQTIESDEDGPYVETTLKHAPSGQFYMSQTPVAVAKQNDSQALKSGSTYSKRMAIQAFTFLATEDDDGQAASKTPKNVIHEKPLKTADSMKTDACTAWIQKHESAEAAISAIQAKYTLDADGIQHIKDEFARKAQ